MAMQEAKEVVLIEAMEVAMTEAKDGDMKGVKEVM